LIPLLKFRNKRPQPDTNIRYENGQDFYFSSLLKILRALDVSLAEFFKVSGFLKILGLRFIQI